MRKIIVVGFTADCICYLLKYSFTYTSFGNEKIKVKKGEMIAKAIKTKRILEVQLYFERSHKACALN